jgi:hypothetical protein
MNEKLFAGWRTFPGLRLEMCVNEPKSIPQGLKPLSFAVSDGTVKAVPFQNARSSNPVSRWSGAKRFHVKAFAIGFVLMLGSFAHSQQTATTPVVPPDAKAARQAEPWTKIPIPPLPPFHPEKPKRVELGNGMVILLE